MTRKYSIVLACIALLFAALACQFVTNQRADEPVNGAVKATAIQGAKVEATAVKAAEAEPTAVQASPTPTEDANAAATQAVREASKATQEAAQAEWAAQATKKAVERLERTAVAETEAASQSDGFRQVVEQLREEKVVASPGGTYYKLDDFEEAWAQMGWWQWWNTGYQPGNFVVRAHTAWESASRTANWFDTGCGFVFRATDANNHYMIYLAMDGYVYMKGYADNKYLALGREYYGTLSPVKGEADVMLVADGNRIAYYVNGEKIFQRDHKFLTSGDLAYTLVSGTNKDFGTRCTISNVELWDLTTP